MGEAEVLLEQQKIRARPYTRCDFYNPNTSTHYIYTTNDSPNIVRKVNQSLEPYTDIIEVTLDNSDQAFTDVNYQGYRLTLGFGFVIAGTPDYINQPYCWVYDQEYDSYPGRATITFKCKGTMSRMGDDVASEEYTPEDDTSPSVIVDDIFDASLGAYDHCQAYTTDWTGVTKATAIDFYYPGGGLKINTQSNRLTMARKLLDNSYVFPRPHSDGKVYFIKPVITGTDYDYEYDLDGVHTFFVTRKIQKAIIPNYIQAYGGAYDDDTQEYEYSGNASTAGGVGTIKYFIHYESITSDAQCEALADAVLDNVVINRKICEAKVPMNCTAKLFDYCKITDARNGNTAIGNIGRIIRTWESGEFTMYVRFGGWRSERDWSLILTSTKRQQSETARRWFTAASPEVYVSFEQHLPIQTFELANGRTLVVIAYNCSAQGETDVDLKIDVNSVNKFTHSSENEYVKLTNEKTIYANGTGSTVTVEMYLTTSNEVDERIASGLVEFAVI